MSSSFLRSHLPCLLAAFVAAALPAAVLPAAHAQSLPEAPNAAPAAGPFSADPWSAPHFSIDPKILYQAASAVPAPDGANVTELCENESDRFDDAGRLVHVGHVVYKVLTQKGAEGWDALAIGWEPWHEARPVIRARVIAPDFTVHTLDPNTVTEAPARGGDYKIYSDGKRLRAPLPAIAPGVVVEEEFTTTETEPLFAAGRVGRVVLGQEDVPVAHSHVVFDFPAALPLRTNLLLLPGIKPVRSESGGRVTLTFDVGALDGIEVRDSYLPPDDVLFPMIEFSTGASWQSIATEYGKIVDGRASSPAVEAVVAPLIAGKKSAAEKEAVLLDFLDREVRYTGIEFGEAAIVPHDPAETLAKKYGDCKDKATLLVAMLRAAGIPAYVALLNPELRIDVPADLPGMGMFNHAIVYVPGKNPLWIDATDRYAQLGQLPIGDQGRLALIASDATTALQKTPEASSRENGLVETREFILADNGPANVVEIEQPKGIFESGYRGYFADKPDKDTRDGMRNYVKSEYVSDDLTKVDRTDPADLSRPFQLTVACEKAKRGYTGLENAQVGIRVDSLFQLLPDELKRKDDSEEQKKAEGQDRPKKPRTEDWWLNTAFTTEWNYRIVPPAGYVPKGLPQDAKIALGPALLTEQFSTGQSGTVLVHLTFDSVKRRYTVAEATELRNKVADLINGPAILLNFEPEGAALLHDGKVKEALASYRALIAAHPNSAVHHLQLANVLLQAGMGGAAREEARTAVKLDPSSALAEKTLAEILKHDLVGREMRAGSDLTGAADAYRAAIKLDPDDHSTQGDLAILLEYDSVGRRYSGHAHIKEAIAEYQKLGQDKLADLGITNNLAYALFYGGDYAGAYKAAQALYPEPKALLAASMAMMQGSKAGLAEANKRASGEDDYKDTAMTAGKMLMRIRQYPESADFLEAGASGDNTAWAIGLARILRPAKRHEDIQFANTPSDAARRYWLVTHDPDLTEAKLEAVLSRNARTVLKEQDPDDLKRILERGKTWNSSLARDDGSLDVEIDIDMQEAAAEAKGEGSDATGYWEKLGISGMSNPAIYVVKEDGVYKVLDTSERPDAIALEILDRIGAGDLNGAKVLLDWLREDVHIEGGDDPLGGPVFPRFWTKGEAPDARKMKLAAASILIGSKPTVAEGVPILEEALKNAAGDRERTNIQLALALGYLIQDNYARLLEVSSALLKDEPESKMAFTSNALALMGLGRNGEALALADARLKLLENDSDALQMKIEIEANGGDFAAARALSRKLADLGKEDAMLLNDDAWYALFTGKVEQADIAEAIRATQLQKDTPSILHTLASLYAEAGNTKDAREVLLRAMDDWNLDEPNEEIWYVLGRIAEQYGERDIAIADYRRLTKPKNAIALPTSTWQLAQIRLKVLGADTTTTPK